MQKHDFGPLQSEFSRVARKSSIDVAILPSRVCTYAMLTHTSVRACDVSLWQLGGGCSRCALLAEPKFSFFHCLKSSATTWRKQIKWSSCVKSTVNVD